MGHAYSRRLAEIALADMGAGELDLTPGEFLVLQDLFLNGQSAIGDIAARTGLAQSRVSTSVRSFIQRGWATTSADPADGRKTLVDLTEQVRAPVPGDVNHGPGEAWRPPWPPSAPVSATP